MRFPARCDLKTIKVEDVQRESDRILRTVWQRGGLGELAPLADDQALLANRDQKLYGESAVGSRFLCSWFIREVRQKQQEEPENPFPLRYGIAGRDSVQGFEQNRDLYFGLA